MVYWVLLFAFLLLLLLLLIPFLKRKIRKSKTAPLRSQQPAAVNIPVEQERKNSTSSNRPLIPVVHERHNSNQELNGTIEPVRQLNVQQTEAIVSTVPIEKPPPEPLAPIR